MFKLVVLCAFLAVVAGKPDVLIAPAAFSTTVLEPAKTTISEHASSVIHPSPVDAVAYSVYPFAHLVKKRSVPLAISSYVAPATYIAAAPVTTYSYTAPLVHSTTILPAAPVYTTAHLIKKRSAPLIAAPSVLARSYIISAPLGTSYSTSYISTAPILSSPFSYLAPTHFIKKRSAPLITSYIAPSTLSAPWYTPTYAAASPIISTPLISSASFAYSPYFIKK